MTLRSQKAACLWESGFTFRHIAEIFGVSPGRASALARRGRTAPEPDEIVFPIALRLQSPVHVLPVSKDMRAALSELNIDTFGQLQSRDLTELWSFLLRYPNIGRKQVEELEQLILQASPNQ